MKILTALIISIIVCSCASPETELKKKPLKTKSYTFYNGSKETKGNLYIKIQDFVHPKTKKKVSLIGMIHIADRDFYQAIQKEIDQADIVLTEGVGGGSTSPVLDLSTTYLFSTTSHLNALLGLSSQHLLKDQGNWQNADMSLSQMSRGALLSDKLSMLGLIPAAAFFEPTLLIGDIASKGARLCGLRHSYQSSLRHFIFKGDDEEEIGESGDKELILGRRNDWLMQEFDEVIVKDEIKELVMPWGAAHCPELELMLLKRGFEKEECRWQRAITIKDLKSDDPEPSSWRFPYLFSWKTQEDYDIAVAAALIKFNTRQENAKLSLAYGLSLDFQWGKSASKMSLVPALFSDKLLSWKTGSQFTLGRHLLRYQSTEGASEFELLPLFATESEDDKFTFTLAPLMTSVVSDEKGSHIEFTPHKIWPVFYADQEARSYELCWPLMEFSFDESNSLNSMEVLQGLLYEKQDSVDGKDRYVSLLYGLLYENKKSIRLEYQRFLNLYSKKSSEEKVEYNWLWPLGSYNHSPQETSHSFFPLYSSSQEFDVEAKDSKFDVVGGLLYSDETEFTAEDDDNETEQLGSKDEDDQEKPKTIKTQTRSLLAGALYQSSKKTEKDQFKESTRRFLFGAFGVDEEGGQKKIVFLWIPISI